jgi:hypothetical protein
MRPPQCVVRAIQNPALFTAVKAFGVESSAAGSVAEENPMEAYAFDHGVSINNTGETTKCTFNPHF